MGAKSLLPPWLERLAALAGSQGQAERAARLWGAAAALREVLGAPLHPAERLELEETMGQVRAAIGDEAWRIAWEDGRAMSPEEAMAYALESSESYQPC